MSLFTAAAAAAAAAASSSSSTKANFNLFTYSQNINKSSPKIPFKFPSKTHLTFPPCSSHQTASSSSSLLLEQQQQEESVSPNNNIKVESNENADVDIEEEDADSLNKVLVVRRPVKEVSDEDEESVNVADDDALKSSGIIDASLNEFAKKMPMFEPERVESRSGEKPLAVNLDLALYKAKILTRKYKYQEAQEILEKCIKYWPEDGRPYVALGKILVKQFKTAEARAVYVKGSQATQGENPYIWQCWAVLENKMGNIGRARELFDAATVADKRHIAAWHGWAVLELKQGNIKKARHLLAKGLKFCGGNEYIYQTLALLEAKANRYDQARNLFQQATKCNPRSCASWLAWAQLEMQQENNFAARKLFEKAVQASPKNRFAWHVWGIFEASMGYIDKGTKLLKIGHTLNPGDPVLLQSLALLEYKYSTANLARKLFRRASEIDPRHQPVWIAWGWMEWKEGNIGTARELYQKALSIDSTSESAARCLQAWGVLEQRIGNLSAARRLFRSSLNINSQSYITWMTWAQLEEAQGNSVRAEEIRNLYFQQRTEVVDDGSWVMGLLDIIDPALDRIKRLLNLERSSENKEPSRNNSEADENTTDEEIINPSSGSYVGNDLESATGFHLDNFIREKLSLEPDKLDVPLEMSQPAIPWRNRAQRRVFRSNNKTTTTNV